MIARRVAAAALFAASTIIMLSGHAQAQNALSVGGALTGGHLLMSNGGRAMDAGGSVTVGGAPQNSTLPGTRPTGIGIVNPGLGNCQFSAYATGSYLQLCTGFEGNNALITLDGLGGASAPALNFRINGTNYPFPGSGSGNVSGPNPSTAGLPALFNSSTGNLLTQATGSSDINPGTFSAVTNSIVAGSAGRYMTPVYGSAGGASNSTSPSIREEYFLNNAAGGAYPWIAGHAITTVVPTGADNKFAGFMSEMYTGAGKRFEQMAGIFHWYGIANQDDTGPGGGGEALWALVGNGDGGPDAGCTARSQPCVRASSAGALEVDTRNNWAQMSDVVPLSTRLVGTIGAGATSGTLANCGGLLIGEAITIHGAGAAGVNLVTSLTAVGALLQGGNCAVQWAAATTTATTNAVVDAIGDFTAALPSYYMYGLNYGEDFSTFGGTDAINIQGQSSARVGGAAVSVGIRDVGYMHVGIALDSAVAFQDPPANAITANPIDILHGSHSTIKEAYYLPGVQAIGWTWQTVGTKLKLCGATCANEFFDLDTSNGSMNIAAQPVNILTSGGAPGQISGSIAQANLLFSSGTFGDFGIRSPGLIYIGSTALGTTFVPTVVIASTATQFGNQILITNQAPGTVPTPAGGTFAIYMDNVDAKLKAKGPGGTVTTLALP